MAKKPLPSPEVLRQLLRYEPETGRMFWIARRGRAIPSGAEAFTTVDPGGYRQGRVFGTNIQAHRIAWALAHGRWPSSYIDHINGDKLDNWIANLREATTSENNRNKSAQKNNTSGFKGVSWHSGKMKWRAQIAVYGKNSHMGYFDTPEEAHEAYSSASIRLHGEFGRVE